MHWDRLFEDLEGQLAAEWDAERAALDAESERLRIAKVALRTRLRVIQHQQAAVALRLRDGTHQRARLRAVGADWLAADPPDAAGALIVPLAAIVGAEVDHRVLLDTLDAAAPPADGVRDRMTLGFLLRDLARRRIPVHLHLDADAVHGTIDRAGADHLDLAVHDAGDARRASAVRAFRMVPFAAITRIRCERPIV